jgi:hypothetical protein
VNTSPHINCSDIVLMHWMRVDALTLWSKLRDWKARACASCGCRGNTGFVPLGTAWFPESATLSDGSSVAKC